MSASPVGSSSDQEFWYTAQRSGWGIRPLASSSSACRSVRSFASALRVWTSCSTHQNLPAPMQQAHAALRLRPGRVGDRGDRPASWRFVSVCCRWSAGSSSLPTRQALLLRCSPSWPSGCGPCFANPLAGPDELGASSSAAKATGPDLPVTIYGWSNWSTDATCAIPAESQRSRRDRAAGARFQPARSGVRCSAWVTALPGGGAQWSWCRRGSARTGAATSRAG
jgi:hypothetical protein